MQLAISADMLVPLGAGAVALIIALFVVLTGGRRKRSGDPASTDAVAEPTAADWTGESASGPSDPSPARPTVRAAVALRPVRPSRIVQPTTVAEAVAAREADTTPLPIQVAPSLRREVATETARADGSAHGTAADRPAHATAEPAPPAAVPEAAATVEEPAATLSEPPAPPAAEERAEPAGAAAVDRAEPARAEPARAESARAEPAEPEPNWAAPPVVRPLSAGSSRGVADAVAQALAARAAAAGRVGAAAGSAALATPGEAPGETPAPPRADARDRLLAVLLHDPVRAVGAAADLEVCRDQLERLTDAVQHERSLLATALRRLAEAGLEFGQIVRLSGLPAAEVRALLESASRREN